MPRIQVHTVQDAPQASRPALEQITAAMGRTLNIHGEMAASPAVIGAYQGIGAAIREHGSFDPRPREAIALAVGAVDGCDYCQAAHTLSARKAGFSLEQTVQIRTGRLDGDTKLTALITLVRQAAENVGSITDQVWDCARAAGWTEGELAEAFAHSSRSIGADHLRNTSRLPAGGDLDARSRGGERGAASRSIPSRHSTMRRVRRPPGPGHRPDDRSGCG